MSLVEDAKAAKEAGLTYGQYMMQKPFRPYQKQRGKKCENCGGVFYGGQMRFCSSECRYQMKAKTAKGDLFV